MFLSRTCHTDARRVMTTDAIGRKTPESSETNTVLVKPKQYDGSENVHLAFSADAGRRLY